MSPQTTRKPPPLPRPIRQALRPFQRFFRTESAAGIVLLLATAAALAWANSPWGDSYRHLLEQPLGIRAFGTGISWPLHAWINDALMAVFFFVVGMEIKRELVLGELSNVRKAVLPAIAALGGMSVPALLYLSLNLGGEGVAGWGVPVATDIAFALGALALLKARVTSSLAIFLTALAIFDDLGAIVVIALFYGQGIHLAPLLAAGAITLVLVVIGRLGMSHAWPYLVLGLALWAALLGSGVHATIAGVILGLCIPARPRRGRRSLEAAAERRPGAGRLEEPSEGASSLLDRLVAAFHPWVAFGIVPLFALANAGLAIGGLQASDLASPVTVGVALGLVAGKPLGIFGATWLAVRLGLSPRPTRASWSQLFGVAMLGGIGFTMSLFIAGLAFPSGGLLNEHAKMGILLGSAISGLAGALFLRFAARPAADS